MSCTLGTEIDAGTLQLGSNGALPVETDLVMDSPATLDLNGFTADVSTLTDTAGSNAIITNNDASGLQGTLEIRNQYRASPLYDNQDGVIPSPGNSRFAGTFEDGQGGCEGDCRGEHIQYHRVPHGNQCLFGRDPCV